ncbi:E3 ubiquitin-protein ligase RBBP6 [Caenorhabditis elegans]|uniref:E3 ubiquitin-protein ligase RBBP6 n=1 Tax=Caenorhabditis elegans TaxID=6239 RepID=Q38G51_CAEEL|nr:E3 ubiquitin-protein ligase RBBP6 [Caenorhabditis elegans]CAJ34990.1 E3 ubiquitin-protein ligase RBBP6 [Caenorhabditis elegans]|eukprot:NP_001032976.1 Retinoblastoma Binding Protein Like [Caenorhabditis elegans]
MSSIHYKFRAELDYKTLQFDGLHIRGEQLVREICAKENLKLELFELQLQNAHTKKTYSDDELIPRNSSIIVQRFPRKDAAKVQKVQAGVNSGMVNQLDATSSFLDPSSHISSAEFENMDEAERLNHIRDQSTRAYDQSNFRRRQPGIMTGPPPPTYTCNRCSQPGHWYKNCPMKLQAPKTKVKREDKKRDDRKDYERDRERRKDDYEKEKSKRKESDRDNEKEKQREKEVEKEHEKDRKEKRKIVEKESEKPRKSVHERMQKADSSTSSSSRTTTAPSLERKPVSFTVASSKPTTNIRVRQYSSSSSTKEQEDEERSKRDRRKKDETDVESIGEKEKKSSSRKVPKESVDVKHKSTKIKFDLL